MPKRTEIEYGKPFADSYWIPLSEAPAYYDGAGNKFRMLHCVCRCGAEKDVLMSNITQKKSVSCGCHRS